MPRRSRTPGGFRGPGVGLGGLNTRRAVDLRRARPPGSFSAQVRTTDWGYLGDVPAVWGQFDWGTAYWTDTIPVVDASASVVAGSATADGGTVAPRALAPIGLGSAVADGGGVGERTAAAITGGTGVAAGGTVVPREVVPVGQGSASAAGGTVAERAVVPIGAGDATAGGGTVAGLTGASPVVGTVGPGSAVASGGTVSGSVVEPPPPPPVDDDEGGGVVDETAITGDSARAFVGPGLAVASGGPVFGYVRESPVLVLPRRRRRVVPARFVDSGAFVRPGRAVAAGAAVSGRGTVAPFEDEQDFEELLASGALETLLA